MAVSIKKLSRLRFSTLQEVEGFTFFDLPKLPPILLAADDLLRVIESSDRIDNLAYEFYGTPDLWWVLALANDIRLLPRDLKLNMKLVVPSRQRVFNEILPLVKVRRR